MLKELFSGSVRAGLSKFEYTELPAPQETNESMSVECNDSIKWRKEADCLRVEFTRTVTFEPSCNFEVTATYFVEHLLKEKDSLVLVSNEIIKKEIAEDKIFFIQAERGFIARISLLIAQLTASFGNPPLILPPNMMEGKQAEE